jgi:hypothetical protein
MKDACKGNAPLGEGGRWATEERGERSGSIERQYSQRYPCTSLGVSQRCIGCQQRANSLGSILATLPGRTKTASADKNGVIV